MPRQKLNVTIYLRVFAAAMILCAVSSTLSCSTEITRRNVRNTQDNGTAAQQFKDRTQQLRKRTVVPTKSLIHCPNLFTNACSNCDFLGLTFSAQSCARVCRSNVRDPFHNKDNADRKPKLTEEVCGVVERRAAQPDGHQVSRQVSGGAAVRHLRVRANQSRASVSGL